MTGTWHYGLIARWWAEVNQRDASELPYLRAAIRRFGEPALDLGCGAGRLLVPLLEEGFDVDGVDVSADMVARCAVAIGASTPEADGRLAVAPFHELAMPRRYGTVFSIGSLAIGGSRERDVLALERIRRHLLPNGALIISYEIASDERVARLLDPARPYPRPWPDEGDRATMADGDELEIMTRAVNYDAASRTQDFEIRARLRRAGAIVREESGLLRNTYYRPEDLAGMLRDAGFATIAVEGPYTSRPPAPDDDTVVIVAR